MTVKQAIFIKKKPEEVWDYIQNYENRKAWDKTITEATAIQENPNRIIYIKDKWGLDTKFVYKIYQRPNLSKIVLSETKSLFVQGGGGVWEYIEQDEGTLWKQTNTITLKKSILVRLIKPFIKLSYNYYTLKGMKKVKKILESN